ncbi:hypothetical protein AJ79_04199 [Helicocarpus griseus UAMH5409]|uniref:RTA1 domain-containing protein n=1 Tax=Helicocarpus griseus UAMH5409 TaxID=1447875 RepID=A0A2B7XVJ0_9EURO|nr:hypothetical protein AJ79_04199 [Helicocarpus griseus UAMH5409]
MDFTFHNGTNGSDPYVDFYAYTPSDVAGYAFMALFGTCTVVHFILIFPFRAAYFIPLVMGGICETFGYYGRAWAHSDPHSIKSWALQYMLIICAPPFIAATAYMTLSRFIIALEAEHLCSIRPRMITVIFVTNDIICFLTQLAGAGVQITGDPKVMEIGSKVVVGGLAFSLVIYCWFIWIAWRFQSRLTKEGAPRVPTGLAWKKYMGALYIACGAMMVRNLVRAIEFGQGKGGNIVSNEAFLYVFDGFLMLVAMGAFMVFHPGLLVKRAREARKN